MTLTVQAQGSTGTGCYLQVKVLNGAIEAGGASGSSGAASEVSVTPNSSNSLILFSNVYESAATAFTNATNNTFYNNATDTNNGGSYAQGFYSGTVTGGTGVTVGSSAPTGGDTAAYEVKSSTGSTPAIDGSSPALVTSVTVDAVTTAAFTPPVGTVLVAMVGVYSATGTPTVTVSGGGLTWTQRSSGSSSANGLAAVWTATVTAATAGPIHAQFSPSYLTRYRHGHFGPVPRQITSSIQGYIPQQYTQTLTGQIAFSGQWADSFAGYTPVNTCLADTFTFGAWEVYWGSTADGGCTQLTGPDVYPNVLQLQPATATSSGQTFSSLTKGPAVSGNVSFSVWVRTVQQLRTGSAPNNWEVAWVFWDFSYPASLTDCYYYIIKVTGTEIGRLNNGVQTILSTTNNNYNPFLWHSVEIVQSAVNPGVSTTITAYVDGAFDQSYTDTSASALSSGVLAAYCEDSETHWTNWALGQEVLTRQAGTHQGTQAAVTGTVTRNVSRVTTAAAAVYGASTRRITRALSAAAAVTASVSLSRVKQITFAAALTLTSAVIRQPGKLIQGSVTVTDALTRSISRTITTVVIMSGTLVRGISVHLPSPGIATIALDGSTPGVSDLASSTSLTNTTASFSPQSKSLTVVAVNISMDVGTGTPGTVTVADSLGNSYTAGPSALNSGGWDFCYLFTHYYASAPGSVTVTANRTDSTSALFEVKTWVLNGCASNQAGAASASYQTSADVTAATTSITTTVAGSWVLATLVPGQIVTFTAVGLTTDTAYPGTSPYEDAATGHYVTVTPGPVTLGWTISTASFVSLSLLEILPGSVIRSLIAVTGSVAASKFKLVLLSAVTAVTGFTARNVTRIVTSQIALTATVTRSATRVIATTVAVSGAAVRSILKPLTVMLVLTGTVIRQTRKLVQGTTVLTGTVLRKLGKHIIAFLGTAANVVATFISRNAHSGFLKIILPGADVRYITGVFSVTLPGVKATLTGFPGTISVIRVVFPLLSVSVSGKIYSSRVKAVLPKPQVSIRGMLRLGLRIHLPEAQVFLSGKIVHAGPFSVEFGKLPLMLLRNSVGLPEIAPTWVMSNPKTNWEVDMPETEWSVGSGSTSIYHLSTEYVLIPVRALRAGVPYNPTSDTVQFAFAPTMVYIPQSGDWVAGAWDTNSSNLIYPYSVKCLVGPNGVTNLVQGSYIIYVKITDNPETPVLAAGTLVIT